MRNIFLSVILFVPLLGQFYVTGEVAPMVMIRQSDKGVIQLPTRSLSIETGYAFRQVDIISNVSLEHRWNGNTPKVDMRELYAIWYPNWGEVKIGKQILAWGAADGNNPTDNVNPYDYYFMFLPGTERKLGSPLLSVTVVGDLFQIEGVIIPQFQANRMPFNEPDFDFIPLDKPDDDLIITPEKKVEWGLRWGAVLGETDFSVSYFRGHDRIFINSALLNPAPGIVVPNFSYRRTQVWGADVVGFLGAITYRVEGAFFDTQDENWEIPSAAKYYQLVSQIEFTGPLDIQFSTQWLKSKVLDISGKISYFDSNHELQILPLSKELFQPGMGTPFAMLAENGIMAGAKATLLDNTLELGMTAFYDLDEYGKMLGFTAEYSPLENWKVLWGITTIKGSDRKPDYPFTALEDFSHYRLGLVYSF